MLTLTTAWRKSFARIAAVTCLGMGLVFVAGAARADLIINPNGNTGGVQATPETPLDGSPGFPCTGCTTNPVTTFGYTNAVGSGGAAVLVAGATGDYVFTLEGSGDTVSRTKFTSGVNTFTSFPPGGTGAGSTPNGTSFREFLTAGTPISFSFTSSTGCKASNGVLSTRSGCAYLIALADSLTAPGATASQATAWIGLTEGLDADHDYQDLVVKVHEAVPEPASLALLGVGLVGLGLMRRARQTAPASED